MRSPSRAVPTGARPPLGLRQRISPSSFRTRVVDRGDARQQVEVLADEPHLGEPEMEASRSDRDEMSRPPINTSPDVGSSSVATINSKVVLPEPEARTGRPSRRRPPSDYPVDGAHRLPAGGRIVLDEFTQLKHRLSPLVSI